MLTKFVWQSIEQAGRSLNYVVGTNRVLQHQRQSIRGPRLRQSEPKHMRGDRHGLGSLSDAVESPAVVFRRRIHDIHRRIRVGEVQQRDPVHQIARALQRIDLPDLPIDGELKSTVCGKASTREPQRWRENCTDPNIVKAEIIWVISKSEFKDGAGSCGRDNKLHICPADWRHIGLIEKGVPVPGDKKFIGRSAWAIQPKRKQIRLSGDSWNRLGDVTERTTGPGLQSVTAGMVVGGGAAKGSAAGISRLRPAIQVARLEPSVLQDIHCQNRTRAGLKTESVADDYRISPDIRRRNIANHQAGVGRTHNVAAIRQTYSILLPIIMQGLLSNGIHIEHHV